MSGLFGTTAGPWKIDFDKVSVAIPFRGVNCTTSTYGGTEQNTRAIAQVPAMLELVAAVVGASDADDMQDRALELARKIVAELEKKS